MSDKRTLGAIALIALGFMLLLNIGSVLLAGIFMVTLVLPGAALLYAYEKGDKFAAILPIPGLLLLGTGAILIFQSLTGYWESWAYAWTLYGVFLGWGLFLTGKRIEDRSIMTMGRWLVAAAGLGFVGLGVLFTMLTNGAFAMLIAIGMIAVGGYLLLTKKEQAPAVKAKTSDHIVHENIERVKIAVEDENAVA